MKGAMYSPFENGVLRQRDGHVRIRSSSERGNNRIAFENNRLSFRQDPEVPIASSPTLHEDTGQRIYTESTQGDFEDGEGTYTTPAILEEDEDDPRSHAAMSRRAEAILANAKKRLTVSDRVSGRQGCKKLKPFRTWKEISIELEALFILDRHLRCHHSETVALNLFHFTHCLAKAEVLVDSHPRSIAKLICLV